MTDPPPDELALRRRDARAEAAIRGAWEIVRFMDDADEIDAATGGLEVLALGVLALQEQRDELAAKLNELED